MVELKESDIARFWAKVKIGAPDECWEWQASTLFGYGRFRLYGKTHYAHRISFYLANGFLPVGSNKGNLVVIMHDCENKLCVNPAHLVKGSQKENLNSRGNLSKKYKTKITPNKGLLKNTILKERKSGIKLKVLSARYGISVSLLSDICNNRAWKGF